jgi:hypothetical protein
MADDEKRSPNPPYFSNRPERTRSTDPKPPDPPKPEPYHKEPKGW